VTSAAAIWPRCVAEPDEHHVGQGTLRPVRASNRLETFSREAMGESREEVVDLGAAHELADRVVHHSLDGRAGNLVELVEGASTALSTC
jgi:hypothetical protein